MKKEDENFVYFKDIDKKSGETKEYKVSKEFWNKILNHTCGD